MSVCACELASSSPTPLTTRTTWRTHRLSRGHTGFPLLTVQTRFRPIPAKGQALHQNRALAQAAQQSAHSPSWQPRWALRLSPCSAWLTAPRLRPRTSRSQALNGALYSPPVRTRRPPIPLGTLIEFGALNGRDVRHESIVYLARVPLAHTGDFLTMVLAQPCRFRALMASVTVSPRAVLPLKLGLGVLFGSRKGILELKIDTIADRGFLPLPAIDQSGAGSIGISAGGKEISCNRRATLITSSARP